MIQVVKAGAVEATHHVHYVVKDDRLVESPLLGDYPRGFNLGPLSCFHFVAEQIVEALLTCVHSTEDKDCLIHHHS